MNTEDGGIDQFEIDQQEIRQLVWQNKIPVKFVLDSLSVGNDQEPLPLYSFIQRVHHPIFYYKQIHEYFEKFAPLPRNQNDIWLEWDGKPISWNIPFGVTFDLNYRDESVKGEMNGNDGHHIHRHTDSDSSSDSDETAHIPFYPIVILVHYGPCGITSELIPIERGKDLMEIAKANFKFNLKESLLIRNNSTFVLTQVNLSEQEQFLNSFVQANEKEFFPILDMIFSMKSHINNNHLIKLPLRIYIQNYHGRIQIQEPILTGNETLGDLLAKFLPKVLRVCVDSYEIVNPIYKHLKVLCNGIVCNLNMPLLYFYKHFFHYDGFTYLAIQF